MVSTLRERLRSMVDRSPRGNADWPCLDCGASTKDFENYMVRDQTWAEARAPKAGFLCIGCLENRLERDLGPDDFPCLPANDDHECDSVRLRLRKGSGRRVGGLYEIGARAVVRYGATVDEVAFELGLVAACLQVWVDALGRADVPTCREARMR